LLEVLLSVVLLALGMAVVGVQFQDSWTASITTEQQIRYTMLAESTLSDLDAGILELDKLDDIYEEDYGPLFPQFGWRMIIEETITPDLNLVTIEVLHFPREEYREQFDFDDAKIVHTVRVMRATPLNLDFELDFGLEESKLEELTEKVGADIFDPYNFDPQTLRKLPPDQLLEVIPLILDAMGISSDDFAGMLPPEAAEALNSLQQEEESGTGGAGSGGDQGAGDQGNPAQIGDDSGGQPGGNQPPTVEDLQRGLDGRGGGGGRGGGRGGRGS
jgi:hypothetical protein